MEKKKILIGDDQPDVQLLLKRRLEASGYDIIQAEYGEKGLYSFIDNKPDLILTDIVMPKMDGVEFFKRLRNIEGGKNVPVIVLSKRALMKDCFDDGYIEGFFAKPFDTKAVIEKIAEVLSKWDFLKALDLIGKKQRESLDSSEGQDRSLGRNQDFCKRCGKELTEVLDRCPSCGGAEFVTRIVYD